MSAIVAPPSPFKGLAPFDDSELDTLLFFGRARETEVIAANLQASRLTVLYGPTGVGKSSVLHAGVVDELEVAVAPFVIGEPGAPRLTGSGRFPSADGGRAVLADVRRVDDLVLMRYGLSARFEGFEGTSGS